MSQPQLDSALNMSLSVTNAEREKSSVLNTGYDALDDTYEIIVRYSAYPEKFFDMHKEVSVKKLVGNYLIVKIKKNLIYELADEPGVIYIEMPKKLYFGDWKSKDIYDTKVNNSDSDNKIFFNNIENLTGKGVIVGIADSGIDIFHPAFLNKEGKSRILYLFDQSTDTEYDNDKINRLVKGENSEETEVSTGNAGIKPEFVFSIYPNAFRDLSGHGTAVAGVAAGSKVSRGDFIAKGYAPEADIIVVRLKQAPNDYIMTTNLMLAVDYLVKKATELNKPMAINLSIGNNFGSHSGNTLLATFLSEVSFYEKVVICAGSGNEAGRPVHTVVNLKEQEVIIVPVALRQQSFSIQIWKEYPDICDINVQSPTGEVFSVFTDAGLESDKSGALLSSFRQFQTGSTILSVYNGRPSPYQLYQEIFLDFIPINDFVTSGNWRIIFKPKRVVSGFAELWLPAGNILNDGTGFTMPSAENTLTIPSTSQRVITVGAINGKTQTYATFSGRGYTAFTRQIKPDVAAPGVDVTAPKAGNSMRRDIDLRNQYGEFTGTSFAAPAVTGTAALLMEWGIVLGNDPWMYGERLKSVLIRNAEEIRAYSEYPNPYVGWGVIN